MPPPAMVGPATVRIPVRARARRWLLPLLLVGLVVGAAAAVTGHIGSPAAGRSALGDLPGQAQVHRAIVADRPSRSCDVRVRGLPALSAAVARRANDGRTICVTRGGSGASLRWSVRHKAMTRVVAMPADGSVAIPGIEFAGASNITVKGFRLTSNSELSGNPSHIRLVKNQMRDMSDDVLDTHGPASDIWFVGNQVRNIRFSGDAFTGYGIQTFGGPIDGLHVNYNTFAMGGASADAMQLGDVHDFEIVGNVIRDVRYSGPAEDPHADAIMLWDGASRGLVKDNRITDSMTTLWSGSTSDVRLENNLIARMRGWCHDGGPTGSSDEGLVRYTWVRNTVYDCGSAWSGGGFGGISGLLTRGPATAGASNTLSRNVLTSLDVGTSAQFAASDHNLIKNGTRPGATDLAFTPQFADLIDYRPTNLPAGYEDVGYRSAPAGPMAAP
jgi:hypothetical protein